MGYDTNYQLHWTSEPPTMDQVCRAIAESEYWQGNHQAVVDAVSGGTATWYQWADDLQRVALRWPETTFTLQGHGDDYEDVWSAFFRGGHWYQEHAAFPVPDEERLSGRWQGERPTAAQIADLVNAETDLDLAMGERAEAFRRNREYNQAADQAKRAREHREGSLARIAHFCNTGRYAPRTGHDGQDDGRHSPEDLRREAEQVRQLARLTARPGSDRRKKP